MAKNASRFRIIVVNDEPGPLKSFEAIIRSWFKGVTLLLFESSSEAWEELSKPDPDLLITDDKMPSLTGEEIVRRLVVKNVTYPIIVNSPWEPTERWVRECAILLRFKTV